MNRNRTLTMLFAAATLLAGCGSGDDGDAVPAPPPAPAPPDPLAAVPEAARQSTDGLIIYLKTLSLQPSDTREPATLEGVELPSSDSAEPTPI